MQRMSHGRPTMEKQPVFILYSERYTGIPTLKTGKRGSELKILFQKMKNGALHFCGISIGQYKLLDGWKQTLSVLTEASGKFAEFILKSDGDSTIMKAALSLVTNIHFQRDKWHIIHQLKYALWQDGVSKQIKINIIQIVYRIVMLMEHMKPEIRLNVLFMMINQCIRDGYTSTATYLENCKDGLFTYNEYENDKFTSKTERSMRTINQRINVGVWSEAGALNVIKILLSYYYNGIGASDWQMRA